VLTTFDRYLLKRYLHSFVILFVSMYGLFVVIDGFTNVDGFQEGLQSPVEVLTRMARYYCFQSFQIFDQVASVLSVIAVMIVFALLQRNSEFHPVLAAGVPTLRLLFPVMVGTMLVNALVIANQELVIPQIAQQLQAPRNGKAATGTPVEPLYDRTRIHIDGKALHVVEQRLEKAKFLLPQPDLSRDLTTLKAQEAIYIPETKQQPSGWLLRDVRPAYDEIPLTEAGRKFVRRTNNPADVFVVTDVSFDQLSNRAKNFRYLSTPHLIRRIKNSSTGLTSLRGQTLFFHTRLVRPILNVIAVLLIVPIILRRESRGLVTNMAVCTLLMGTLYGVAQVFSYLGQVNIMAVDMAAWSPVIFNGSFGVWIYGFTQT
jgi:lipopolysaccharide export system permease protein